MKKISKRIKKRPILLFMIVFFVLFLLSSICLTYSIHELFHKNYGYGDNTKEQFLEEYYNSYKDIDIDILEEIN